MMNNMYKSIFKVLLIIAAAYMLLRIFITLVPVIIIIIFLFMVYKKFKDIKKRKHKVNIEQEHFVITEEGQRIIDVDYEDIK